ncbi:MFS transporter [Ornithinimicrobium sp. F0845]|uniref:MFS transporter n=1 Tax=Ornithinimicrobium sp. F0845 TaxID=2926412 RepID=UPI001FF6AAB8|nr:MFS transporter [Ornithinimicrobium sp. F0845]
MTPPAEPTRRAARPLGAAFVLLATALIAINLRPVASSVGPVLEEVTQGLGMSTAVAGFVTALPGLCFGLIGALAVGLARRVGMTTGIVLGLLAVGVGLLARAAIDSTALFLLLTALALGGAAIGNVLVPAWIKRQPRDVRLMTIYSAGLTLGGAMAAALVAPISAASDLGWRAALGVWGLVALVAVLPWALIASRERRTPGGRGSPAAAKPTGRIWHSSTAIALTVVFGIQSMNAYVQFGWLPQIYRDAGLSAGHAGILMSLLTALTLIGALMMPTVIARSPSLQPWMYAFGALLVIGNAGLLLAPATVPWLWAIILGTSGFAFPTAIALITARTRDPQVTARLSGFVQPMGYMLAAVGPFVVGVIYQATGTWTIVLILLMLSGVVLTLAGLRVSRHTWVDDELAA